MAQDKIFQYLMDQMFPYFYVKYGEIPLDLERTDSFVANNVLTEDLFEVIAETLYVVGCVLLFSWSNFLNEHYALMALSPKHYISLVTEACYIENHFNCSIYERFISVCSLVTVMGKYTYTRTNQAFYKLTPLILTVFFENVMKKDFEKHGSWKNLEKYLTKVRSSDWYDNFKSSRNFIDHFDSFPEEMKTKVKELAVRRRSIRESDAIVKTIRNESEISDLIQKVLISTETSILYELCWLSFDEKPRISKKDEVSASNSSPCSSTICLQESEDAFKLNPISDSRLEDNRAYIKKTNNASFSTSHSKTKVSSIGHNAKAETSVAKGSESTCLAPNTESSR
ncbi:uncharacterized protein TNCT_159471 [Trichonephila clavata]|uniref:Uncharacterized protein n=1 Tax=Trichonephila clavata TaxID=2740835 RepID=A0A8X6IHM1_TRICU|nr:uncharacterized protein TNCT_159471 [Trichonephila clavata]